MCCCMFGAHRRYRKRLCCSENELSAVTDEDAGVASVAMQQCHDAEDGQVQVRLCGKYFNHGASQ